MLGAIYYLVSIVVMIGLGRFVKRSVRRCIEDVVDDRLVPQVEKIHNRIDEHMAEEETSQHSFVESIQQIQEDIAYMRGQWDATVPQRGKHNA